MRILAVGVLMWVLILGVMIPVFAQTREHHTGLILPSKGRTVTVNGTGSASVEPDVAQIRVAVVTSDEKSSKAAQDNKVNVGKVFKVFKKFEIADKDLCTTNYSVSPKYQYNKDVEAKQVGYTVSNEIHVVVRKLDQLGDILDGLTDSEVSLVSSVQFDVLDKEAVLDKARELAVADALRKAKLLTKATGDKVGEVLTITESEHYASSYVTRGAMRADGAGIAKGERQFRVSVSLVIEIK